MTPVAEGLPRGRIQRPGVPRLEGTAVAQLRLERSEPTQKFYPARARSEGIDGSAVVDLLVNEAGQVVEAQVISESPAGYDFGLAALDAAKTFEFANDTKKMVLISLLIEFLP